MASALEGAGQGLPSWQDTAGQLRWSRHFGRRVDEVFGCERTLVLGDGLCAVGSCLGVLPANQPHDGQGVFPW